MTERSIPLWVYLTFLATLTTAIFAWGIMHNTGQIRQQLEEMQETDLTTTSAPRIVLHMTHDY